jgi:hypothetical protein
MATLAGHAPFARYRPLKPGVPVAASVAPAHILPQCRPGWQTGQTEARQEGPGGERPPAYAGVENSGSPGHSLTMSRPFSEASPRRWVATVRSRACSSRPRERW